MELSKIKSLFRQIFSLRWDNASAEEIKNAIISSSKLQGTNMCILILAIIIASVGLNMNSTATIIGAMLISPLMGNIVAIGYGIATDDLSFSKLAALRLSFQVVLCIFASSLYFLISPISTAHSELLARTSPTVWDVLIAICGGFAGIIGMTRKEKGNVIPGVAIATALMPPLCTAGFAVATKNLSFFLGALYLFFINGFFICITSIIVLRLLKLPIKKLIDLKAKKRFHFNLFLISIITIIPSIVFACKTVNDNILNNNIKSYISKEFNFDNTEVVKYHIDKKYDTLNVILLGEIISPSEISTLSDSMKYYNLNNLSLKITQTDENSSSSNYTKILQELKSLFPEIEDASIGEQLSYAGKTKEDRTSLVLIITCEDKLSDDDIKRIKSWLKIATNTKLNIQLIETTN